MATERLNINGWDATWSGFVSNVDEPVASADGSTVLTTSDGTAVTFALGNVVDVDTLDIVTAVDIQIRASGSSTYNPEPGLTRIFVELLIGGVSRGTDTLTVGTMSNQTASAAGWDANWSVSDLNSAQVRVTPDLFGESGTGTATWQVDCLDLIITYTPIDPISKAPDEDTLVLGSEAPLVDVSNDSPVEDPAQAPLALAGQAPTLSTAVAVPTGTADLEGQAFFAIAYSEQLQVNGWDNGWPTGFYTNVDEPTSSPDGSTISTSSTATVVLNFDDTTSIADLDTVLNVYVVLRARALEDPGPNTLPAVLTTSLLINGVSRGAEQVEVTGSFVNYNLNVTGWNNDWSVSQLDSLQVRVSYFAEPGEDYIAYIDAVDVVVDYQPQPPFYLSPAAASLTATGQAPTDVGNTIRTPAIDSVALAGQQPELFRVDIAQPPQTLRRLQEYAPTLLRNSLRKPAAYAASLSNELPLRISNYPRAPGSVSLTLSEKLPVREQTFDVFKYPTALSLTLDGGDLVTSRTGTDASVAAHRYEATLVSDPPVAIQSENTTFFPPSAVASLAGLAPFLSRGTTYSVASLSVELQGQVPFSLVGQVTNPTTGAVSLTGQAPAEYLAPYSITLLGYAPNVVGEGDYTPAIGQLTLAGQAPLVENGTKYIYHGRLGLIEHVPTLRFSTSLTPGKPGLVSLTVDRRLEVIGTPTDTVTN